MQDRPTRYKAIFEEKYNAAEAVVAAPCFDENQTDTLVSILTASTAPLTDWMKFIYWNSVLTTQTKTQIFHIENKLSHYIHNMVKMNVVDMMASIIQLFNQINMLSQKLGQVNMGES